MPGIAAPKPARSTPDGLKVGIMLEETGLAYKPHRFVKPLGASA